MELSVLISICNVLFWVMISRHVCSSSDIESKFVCCRNKKGNVGDILGMVKARSNLECSSECLRTDNCLSASFGQTNNTCILYSETIRNSSECKMLDDAVNTKFMFMKRTCANGGTWNSANKTCTACNHGFAGKYCERHILDCAEGYLIGYTGEEAILIQPVNCPNPFPVMCIYRWKATVVLRRGIRFQCNETIENFNRTWAEYRDGFGDVGCEHFIGVENMHLLTEQSNNKAKVRSDFNSSHTISYYRNFFIDDEQNNFRLRYGSYSPHAIYPGGDGFGLGEPDASVRNSVFCTPDRDCGSCAKASHSGWWFNTNCSQVNLHVPLNTLVWPLSDTDDTLVAIDSVRVILLQL